MYFLLKLQGFYMVMSEELNKVFHNLSDPRSTRNQKHPFMSLISIALLGAIAGIDSFTGLEDFSEANYDNLSKVIDLPNGPPSHDTFQRLFNALDIDMFHSCFYAFTQNLEKIKEGVISIDGKTPLHIVNAWSEANNLVLAQKRVHKKSNEITAIPMLLELLDLNNRVITIDAMGCQREICQKIIDGEGDYVISLKGNQGTLHKDVKDYFNNLENFAGDTWEEHDKGHGRIESRKCYTLDNIDYLEEYHRWPGLKSIAMVVSKRETKGKISTETRYLISSLPKHAEKMCRTARSHWSVENKLHWRLDVVYNEDKGCITNENALENTSLMRKWALNILSQHKGKGSIKSLQRKAAMSFAFLENLLEKIFHA